MWGQHVIVPAKLRNRVKIKPDKGQVGSQYIRDLARLYVWWLNLDDNLEVTSGNCSIYQRIAHAPPKAMVRP